jgi:hypothetical protein
MRCCIVPSSAVEVEAAVVVAVVLLAPLLVVDATVLGSSLEDDCGCFALDTRCGNVFEVLELIKCHRPNNIKRNLTQLHGDGHAFSY